MTKAHLPKRVLLAICNLQDEGKTCEDALRSDLYYRLAALQNHGAAFAPARRRHLDAVHAPVEQFCDEYGCEAPEVSAQEAAQLLQAPGRAMCASLSMWQNALCCKNRRGSGTIASLLMADNEETQPVMTTEGKPLKEYVEAFERMLIDNTMRRHKGSLSSVMEELCLPRRTLNEKMAKYGLQRSDFL